MPSNPLQIISMPVIGPAPAAIATANYYSNLPGTVTAIDNGDAGLHFDFTDLGDKSVYAVITGNCSYVPGGAILPDGTNSPLGVGSVVLHVGPANAQLLSRTLPSGVPANTYFVYQGVDFQSFKDVVISYIEKVNPAVIDEDWKNSQHTEAKYVSTQTKQANYLARVLAGAAEVKIPGGTKIGELIATTSNTYSLDFKAYEGLLPGNGSKALINAVTPLYFIRFLPETAQNDAWLYHRLITATSQFTRDVSMYIGFQVSTMPCVSDPKKATYLGVDQHLQVDLMNARIGPDEVVATTQTNDLGIAHFTFSASQLTDSDNLYFIIRNPTTGVTIAPGDNTPLILPSSWSTKLDDDSYWLSHDGLTKGYLENFRGFRVGSAITPVWFNIGVDYLFELSFNAKGESFRSAPNSNVGKLVQDLPVILNVNNRKEINQFVDKDGLISGFSLDMHPGDELQLIIELSLDNPNIGLQSTRIISPKQIGSDFNFIPYVTERWCSKTQLLPGLGTTVASPELTITVTGIPLRNQHILDDKGNSSTLITSEFVCAALACLLYTREMAVFFYYLTKGEYSGAKLDIQMFHISQTFVNKVLLKPLVIDAANIPLSFPVGSLYLSTDKSYWTRRTIIHESSHQIMWKEADFKTDDILYQFAKDVVISGSTHQPALASDGNRALTEGWAEAISAIINGLAIDMPTNGENVALRPDQNKLRADMKDILYADKDKYGVNITELNWLKSNVSYYMTASEYNEDNKNDNRITTPNSWYRLDPYPLTYKRPTASRLNLGEVSEGAFSVAIFTLFWEFVIGHDIYQGDRYLRSDDNGNPIRTNSWMTTRNQDAIYTRFKALMWEPLKMLKAAPVFSLKTIRYFVEIMAQQVGTPTSAYPAWYRVRSRLLMWNIALPEEDERNELFKFPELQPIPFTQQRGSLAGGNRVTYLGSNFIEEYTTYKYLNKGVFREVKLILLLGDNSVTDVVVNSSTSLTFTVPKGEQTGPVDLFLKLIVRGVAVSSSLLPNAYYYD